MKTETDPNPKKPVAVTNLTPLFFSKMSYKIIIFIIICINYYNYIVANANAVPLPVISIATGKLQIGDKCGNFGKIGIGGTGNSSTEDLTVNLTCDPDVPLECVGGRCTCKRGYTLNRNETKCLEIARNGLESMCEESIQCWKGLPGRLSECLEGKCRCYESETLPIVFHQGRCYYGEGLGDYCQIEGLCSATTSNATCRSGMCQCREGHIPSWDKSRCLQIATQGLNSSCEENIQCEKSALGTLSECNQDTMLCQCYRIPAMVPTVFHSGRCYFGASLGDVCQVNAQCEAKTKHAICGPDGKCICEEADYISNLNGTVCLQNHVAHVEEVNDADLDECTHTDGAECTKLGQPCKYNRQCSAGTENSACVPPGICGCEKERFVLSQDGQRCLEIGTDGLGSSCEQDDQCKGSILGPLAICERGTCRCSEVLPVVLYEKTCFFQRALGATCDSDSECKAGLGGHFAECKDGRCICGNGTISLSPQQHACGPFQGPQEPSTSTSGIGRVLGAGIWVAVALLCWA